MKTEIKYLSFRSVGVPRKYSDDASRRAVLYQVLGPITGKGDYLARIDAKVKSLTGMWRDRLRCLCAAGLAMDVTRQTVCANCHPSFVSIASVHMVCNQVNLCPFCYGREIQSLYRSVAAVCRAMPKERSVEYWLLGYRKSMFVETNDETRLCDLFKEEVWERRKTYDVLQPFGAKIGSEFEPAREPGVWKVVRRGVALVSSSTDLSDFSYWADSVKRVKQFTGKNIAQLVGWTMKYPTRLLKDGDPERVVELLQARKKARLNASYGLFRKTK